MLPANPSVPNNNKIGEWRKNNKNCKRTNKYIELS